MDPIQYEKIADQLMQFRGKLPDVIILQDPTAVVLVDDMKMRIDLMLQDIDRLANVDQKGWIR